MTFKRNIISWRTGLHLVFGKWPHKNDLYSWTPEVHIYHLYFVNYLGILSKLFFMMSRSLWTHDTHKDTYHMIIQCYLTLVCTICLYINYTCILWCASIVGMTVNVCVESSLSLLCGVRQRESSPAWEYSNGWKWINPWKLRTCVCAPHVYVKTTIIIIIIYRR